MSETHTKMHNEWHGQSMYMSGNKISWIRSIISFCYTAFRIHLSIHTMNGFFKWCKDTIKLLKIKLSVFVCHKHKEMCALQYFTLWTNKLCIFYGNINVREIKINGKCHKFMVRSKWENQQRVPDTIIMLITEQVE
jgi:hypothetical protein